MIRRVVVLSLAALIAAAVMAVPAGAASPELRGVVSGSPYGASGGYIAVPVLYSKMTARRVGLKSPVGLMVVKRTARVKVNGAPSSLPINLRVGDRFKGNAPVSSLNKRIFYPRITFDKAPQVYFRSKELSLSELTRLIQAVQKDLAGLSTFTLQTFGQVATQIAGLQKQIDELRALLNGLPSVDLSGLQAQIDDLTKRVDDLVASLANYALKTDLAGLLNGTQVNSLITTALTTLGITEDIENIVNDIITQLGLPNTTTVTNLIQSAIDDLGLPVDINDLALDDDVQALIDGLGLPADINDLALDSEIPALVDTAVGNLGLPADLDDLALESEIAGLLPASVIHSSELSDELDALLPGTGLDALATDADVAGVAADLAAAEANLDTVCDAVRDAEVTLDPDGAGVLPEVTAPVTLGNAVDTVCAP